MSIACGSAQPLIHSFNKLRYGDEDLLRQSHSIVLTDMSKEALSLARKKAQSGGMADWIMTQQSSFRGLLKRIKGKFDVVEACGILDYFEHDDAISLVKIAIGFLKPDGVLIVSGMRKTKWATILSSLFSWDVIYRSPEELAEIIKSAGGTNIRVNVEKEGIFIVATAQKK